MEEPRVYKNSRKTTLETLRIFLPVIVRRKGLFAVSLLSFVSNIIGGTVLPLLISMTLASIVVDHGASVAARIPWLIAAGVAAALCNYFGFVAGITLNAYGQADLSRMVIDKLLQHSSSFHANNIGGKIVSNALDYPTAYGRLVDLLYIQGVPFVLNVLIGLAVVFASSIELGFGLLVVVVAVLALAIKKSIDRSHMRVDRKKAQDKAIAHLADTIVNVQAVKTFAAEKRESEDQFKLDQHLLKIRIKDWTEVGHFGAFQMGLLYAMQIAFIAYLATLVSHNPAVLGIGIFAFTYTITFASRLFEIGSIIRNVEETFLQSSTMTEIILMDESVKDVPHAKNLLVSKGDIRFDDVKFSYEDAHDNTVFENLSLVIPSGQKVGLVGSSGGGKSTLTRLLLRFDDINSGSISIDDQDIKQATQESLRGAVSYVPQEPLLFHRTIRENIAYGRPEASESEIVHAAKMAYADEFIKTLPKGYDTIVGERGVKLSGGQRQRVAIARAILKNAPIIVLDEATSALDSESEHLIQMALEKLMEDRTSIVIAHRLSTIAKLDRIIVLDNGKIIEDGTHTELLEQHGTYARLWSHQSGGFIEE
jgi:ATP-binding cassette subfamily B protein